MLSRLGSFAIVFVLLSSLSMVYFPGFTASESATLTFTSSTKSAYPVEAFIINASASVPITGPVKLQWTVDGSGPYNWSGQMTNGYFERSFGCASPGNWTIWLVWEGDEQYGPAQSNAVSVLVQPAPTDSDPTALVIVGVVSLVAILGVIGYVALKRRK